MINATKEIVSFSDDGNDFEEFLRRTALIKIFEEIFNEFPEKNIAVGVVKFIVYAFSLDSDMIFIQGGTWATVSKNIFNKTLLPESMFDDVARLENLAVQNCANKWVEFQNDENYTQYQTYKRLRTQFLELSVLPIKTTGLLNDDSKLKSLIDGKMSAAVNSKELLKMMDDAKNQFVQNHAKLKTSMNELRTVNKKNIKTTEEIFASRG